MTRSRITGSPALLVAVVVALSGCANTQRGAQSAAEPQRSSSSGPDPGIVASLNAMNDVCARRDVGAFMALFEDSDDIALIGSDAGEVFRGRKAVAGFIGTLFALPFTFSFQMPDPVIRQRGDMAWVFVDGSMLHNRADGSLRKVPYRITAVMVRQGEVWRWQVFSGSSPRPD
jgi:ketosteroid isomerase-like protein